jgi:hypothetical protein
MKEKINFENYRLLFLHCISLGFWEESNFRKKSDNEEYFETEIILLVRPFKTTTKNIQKAENLERLNILVSSANTNQLVLEYMISSNFITWIAKKLLSKTLLLVLQKSSVSGIMIMSASVIAILFEVQSMSFSDAVRKHQFTFLIGTSILTTHFVLYVLAAYLNPGLLNSIRYLYIPKVYTPASEKSVMLVTKFYNYVQNSKIVESLILSEATKQPRFFIATKLPLLIENSLPGGKKITMVQLAIASLMLEEGAKG